MKVARSLFPSITVGIALVSLLVLGIPVSGFADAPHVCINGHISTDWENLGAVQTVTFAAKTCGHTSNTTHWKFTVKNFNLPYNTYCAATNGGAGFLVSAADPYSLPCPSLPAPSSTNKIKVIIEYKVSGSDWMSHPDLLKRF